MTLSDQMAQDWIADKMLPGLDSILTTCPDCNGEGDVECPDCEGTGNFAVLKWNGDQIQKSGCPKTVTCKPCKGEGIRECEFEEVPLDAVPVSRIVSVEEV